MRRSLPVSESFPSPGFDSRSIVGVRPEAIRLHRVEADPGSMIVECRMQRMVELGIVRLAELSFGKFRLNMLWPADTCPVNVGDKVVCAIRREDLMVFAG